MKYMDNKLLLIFLVFLLMPMNTFMIIPANKLQSISNDNEEFNSKHSNEARWTVMMYLAYDNHQSKNKNHIFKALTNTGSTNDINIIALYDGNNKDDTCYYYARKNKLEPLLWDELESNLADKDTLQKFISLTIQEYPAQHYAFFIQSTHGSGWQGLGCDMDGELSLRKISFLSLLDYSDSLKNVTNNGINKIDIMGFEICVTGSLEAAYQIAPYVHYMISNQEHSFNNDSLFKGIDTEWNFTTTLDIVANNPMISPEHYSKEIVESFKPKTLSSKIFFKFKAPNWYPIVVYKTDLSASNLSSIQNLIDNIRNLSDFLINNMNQCRDDIKKARLDTREYGKQYNKLWWLSFYTLYLQIDQLGYDCFIDLYDFAEKLNNITDSEQLSIICTKIMNNINNLIMITNCVTDDSTHGFSIYFPELKCQYDQFIWRTPINSKFKINPIPYCSICFSKATNWNILLEKYLNI